jgi:hypothetical protein
MERVSTKHGPRLDEEMAHEVRETHTEPERDKEDVPLNDPTVQPEPGSPPGMNYAEVEARSNLGRFIPMASLPGDRDTLISGARDLNAPDEVIESLNRLPEGETYETVNQVWAALGGNNEARRT